MRQRILPFLFALVCNTGLFAQSIIFQENFNECGTLPQGWYVIPAGNPNAVWYVGTPLNDDSDSLSMDGSCCFIIDDDATGDGSPAYDLSLVSPPFDCSQFGTIEMKLDVHYRDWNDAQEFMQILLTDGSNTWLVAQFDENNSTGEQFHEYTTLKTDIALMTNSPTVQLIVRYNDAGGFAWWAGIDNFEVRGFDTGTNVLTESFNGCLLPNGWETQILEGEDDWQIGYTQNGNAYPNSMNGSCFAFFDDDVLGANDTTPSSRVRLFSPWFDGTQFAEYKLIFDLIQRDWREGQLTLYIVHGDGSEYEAKVWSGDVGGPQFDVFESVVADISAFRNKQMRLAFEFWDGNDWGWWTGFDNLKIAGKGDANDLCDRALPLLTGQNCKIGDTRTAVFDGPLPACADKSVSGLWYVWQADFTGVAKIASGANFNDVLTVFTGGCNNPTPVFCNNRDEHGFTGENSYVQVQQGQTYLLRISGEDGGFGESRGDFCVKIEQAPGLPPTPANENCNNAVALNADTPCTAGDNLNAATSATLPSMDERARADIWYRFVAPALAAGEKLEFRSNANFSDVITLYRGGCNNLEELAGTHLGQHLTLENLVPGQTYRIQIAGNLATVEGQLCAEVKKISENTPPNDDCLGATNVLIGGVCVAGNNLDAGFSGYRPPCVVTVEKDIWFKFVAPPGGTVRVNTGADFEHVLAVWAGDCNDLTPVFCVENPLRCQGYASVSHLTAGETYFLQIASWASPSGFSAGDVCVRLLPGSVLPDFQALELQVAEICTGVNTAELLIAAKNGVQPYTYTGNQAGQSLTSGDSYIVVVTDAMGCEQAIVGIVDECTEAACVLNTSVNTTGFVCVGSVGTISVNVTGGVAPYTYNWSVPGNTEATITNIGPGTYTCTITDSEGCESTVTATLSAAPLIDFTSSVSNEYGSLSNGQISLFAVSQIPVYEFVWTSNGVIVGNEDHLNNIPAGIYTVVITDVATSCTTSFTFQIQNIVGTDDPSARFFAEISPNPAVDKAILTVKLPEAEPLQINMLDVSGKLLHTWENGATNEIALPLDLAKWPAGVYSLKIKAGEATRTLKVVIGR